MISVLSKIALIIECSCNRAALSAQPHYQQAIVRGGFRKVITGVPCRLHLIPCYSPVGIHLIYHQQMHGA